MRVAHSNRDKSSFGPYSKPPHLGSRRHVYFWSDRLVFLWCCAKHKAGDSWMLIGLSGPSVLGIR